MVDSLPEPPRVDPAVVQAWRDRQLKNLPKDKLSMAERITAANRLAALFDNPQTLTGGLTKTGAGGASVQVALDKPYKGLSTISAVAATGCDRFGRVTMLRDKNNDWYAFGGGTEKLRSDRDKERSGESGTTGKNIKYLVSVYSIFFEAYLRPGSEAPILIASYTYYACGWKSECIKIGVFKLSWETGSSYFKTGVSFVNTGGDEYLFTIVYAKNPGGYKNGTGSRYYVADMVYALYNQDGLVYEFIEEGVSDLPVNGFSWTGYNPYKQPRLTVLSGAGGKVIADFYMDAQTSYAHSSLSSDNHTIIGAYSGTADLLTAEAGKNPFTKKARWNSNDNFNSLTAAGYRRQIRTHSGINYKSFTEAIAVNDNADVSGVQAFPDPDFIATRDETVYQILGCDLTGAISYGKKVEVIGNFPASVLKVTTSSIYVGNIFLDPNPKPHVYDQNENSPTYGQDKQQYDRRYSDIINRSGFCTVTDDGNIIYIENQRPSGADSASVIEFAFPPFKKEEETLQGITNNAAFNTTRQVAIATISVVGKLLETISEDEVEVFAPDTIDVASIGALGAVEKPQDGDYRRVTSFTPPRVFAYYSNSTRTINGSDCVSAGSSPGRWLNNDLSLSGASYG